MSKGKLISRVLSSIIVVLFLANNCLWAGPLPDPAADTLAPQTQAGMLGQMGLAIQQCWQLKNLGVNSIGEVVARSNEVRTAGIECLVVNDEASGQDARYVSLAGFVYRFTVAGTAIVDNAAVAMGEQMTPMGTAAGFNIERFSDNDLFDRFLREQGLRNEEESLLAQKGIKLTEISALIVQKKLAEAASRLQELSAEINYLKISEESKKRWEVLMVRKSRLARELAGRIAADDDLTAAVRERAFESLETFIRRKIEAGDKEEDKGLAQLEKAKKFINEWLNKANDIPGHIRDGIIRGMLEGRDSDLLFAFGEGWRKFGTAGIRNPAVASEFEVIQDLELDEFDESIHASILTGPNMINTVTILQQQATVAKLLDHLTENIDDEELDLPDKYKKNIRRRKVAIAYDSRIHGEYFAKLLAAAAFLKDGFVVELFDNASGMPGLTYSADRRGSVYGFLISASHSEANFNGFKFVRGDLSSQIAAEDKDMVMDQRERVTYTDMAMDLALLDIQRFDDIFQENNQNLTWLGTAERRPGFNYCGAPHLDFYTGTEADLGCLSYYEHSENRSPLVDLPATMQEELAEIKQGMKAFYTAFYGVGATPAANLPGFFRKMGYDELAIVEAQTEKMDGKFPGHYMPDPGVVPGWVVNLVDFIVQVAGEDLANIDAAIESVNEQEVGVATDPDIDRAGMMLSLARGVKGNIKDKLIGAVAEYMDKKWLTDNKDAVLAALRDKLNDKQLLTANDAWAFMAYYQLQLKEENGLLSRDHIYFIEESHVTTPALEKVAQIFRDKGYKVYVLQTYVGFTELAKKSRDLFDIAKLCWDFKNDCAQGVSADWHGRVEAFLAKLQENYDVLRSHVPPGANSIPEVDSLIRKLQDVLQSGQSADIAAIDELRLLVNMDILYGVEESNGYGEFGRFDVASGEVVDKHICEKDGSLASYKFLELIAYGKMQGKTGYDMYMDMISETGFIATDNRFLPHPGLSGNDNKEAEVQAFEKLFAYNIQKMLDRGQEVVLFNGKYWVKSVEIYRDYKYDSIYRGFPEEGVRLILETKRGSEAVVTMRPSGTGDTIRCYSWILGQKPQAGENLEGYRQGIAVELKELADDFFGSEVLQGKNITPEGYFARSREKFSGLMAALNEAGLQRQADALQKSMRVKDWTLNKIETELFTAAGKLAFSDSQGKAIDLRIRNASNKVIEKYLRYADRYPQVYRERVDIAVGGKTVEIPRAALMAWRTSFVHYLASLLGEQAEVTEDSIVGGDKELRQEVIAAWERTALSRELERTARILGVSDYPRVVQIFKTSMDPVAFVKEIMELSGKAESTVLRALEENKFFKSLVMDYRLRTTQSFHEAETAGKKLDVTVTSASYEMAVDQKLGRQGEPLTDFIDAKKSEAANVPFVFRDNMEEFVNAFLAGAEVPEAERADLVKRIQQVMEFFARIDLDGIRYLVTSGIGANEMYSHQLAQIVNAFFGGRVKWIVVNNPDHLRDEVIPADANNKNTVVFEMSRSGSTKETVDFFNSSKNRFKQRIVAANKGKLKEASRVLAEDPEAVISNIDDIPGDIGGRQMNRKTLMVYVPLFMALYAGTKDVDLARDFLATYVRSLREANDALAYGQESPSAGAELAEFLLRHRNAGGRNKFAVVYDESLKPVSKELFQLMNEGANKNIAGGTNLNILDSYSLAADADILDTALTARPGEQLPLFLLNSNAPGYQEALAKVERYREEYGIPCIVVDVDLREGAEPSVLEHNLSAIARTSALLQDMVVYFAYLTGQDANSNPSVKFVREITSAMFEIVQEKKAADAADIRITLAEVMAKIEEKQEAAAKDAQVEVNKADTKTKTGEYQEAFDGFREAITELAAGLGVDSWQLIVSIIESTSADVLATDIGEAGGAKIAVISEAFSKTIFASILGNKTPPKILTPLQQQLELPSTRETVAVSVILEEEQDPAMLAGDQLAEQIADYLYKMYRDKERGKNLTHMPLVCMEADQDRDSVNAIRSMMVETLAEMGISCPKLALPGVAHTGIEAIMSHPENVFSISIVSRQARGGEVGSAEIGGGVTTDEATYVYGKGNIDRMAVGGSPSVIFEITNADDLAMVAEVLRKALQLFKQRVTAPEEVQLASPLGKRITAAAEYEEFAEMEISVQEGAVVLGAVRELSAEGMDEVEPLQLAARFNEAAAELGLGVFGALDGVRIVNNIDAAAGREEIVPYAKIDRTGGRRVLLLDVDLFKDREGTLFRLVLEHDLREAVMSLIPYVDEGMRELTTNYMSLKNAYEQNIRLTDGQLQALESDLNADSGFFRALAILQQLEEVNDNVILAVTIEYMRSVSYYEPALRESSGEFQEVLAAWTGAQDVLSFKEGVEYEIERYQAAVTIFNDIMAAKVGVDEAMRERLQLSLQRAVEEVGANVRVVRTFAGERRLVGLEDFPRNVQQAIGASAKTIWGVEQLQQGLEQVTAAAERQLPDGGFYIYIDRERKEQLEREGGLSEAEIAELNRQIAAVEGIGNNLFKIVYSLDDIEDQAAFSISNPRVISLLDLEDVNNEGKHGKREDMLYWPGIFAPGSVQIAAHILLAQGNAAAIADPLVRDIVIATCSSFLGKGAGEMVTEDELRTFFRAPWIILGEVVIVTEQLEHFRRAVYQVAKSA